MNEELLAEQFQAHRNHLRAVAYRMLGSGSEADDAVQEAWLRVSRADPSDVQNLGGGRQATRRLQLHRRRRNGHRHPHDRRPGTAGRADPDAARLESDRSAGGSSRR